MNDPIREEFEIKRRLDDLYIALEVCSAELFAQCGDQGRAMKYVEQARKALAAEQCARAALAAPAAPQAGEDAASQVEYLDVENHRLRRAMQKIMARLADLLDEDQFGNIESIVTEAGVEPPEHAAQATRDAALEEDAAAVEQHETEK